MARDAPPLDGLDLNLLVTLRALLRTESVTRAAEELGQRQPTVSRALSTLRVGFGDDLLVRSGRGMALTPLARALRQPVERVLAAMDRLADLGSFEPATARRTFRVTMPDIAALILLPEFAGRVAQTAPHVILQVHGSEREALRTLLDDEVDLVVGAPELHHPELVTRHLATRDLLWSVVLGRHHLAGRGPLDLEDWLASDHLQVTPHGRPDQPGMLDECLLAEGLVRRVTLSVAYVSAVGPILDRTAHVCSLPQQTARVLAGPWDLPVVPHPLGHRLPNVDLRMTWHQVHHADPGHTWLRRTLAAVAEAPD